MSKTFENKDFNTNGVGLKNGNLIGLPFKEITSEVCCFRILRIPMFQTHFISCLAG